MKVNIQSVHFDADKKLVAFVEEKVNKLETLYEGVIGSEVILKLESGSAIENKVAEIKIKVAGQELYAKKQSKSFEESVDESVDALKKQLLKYKEKQKD
ncbi:MAG: ribosome-associated translation inhibitor RaiA [Bacteroidota bacterium]